MAHIIHPELTDLANHIALDEGHLALERYGFPFRASDSSQLKDAVRRAVTNALVSRRNRSLKSGRLVVQIDKDNSLIGLVVDVIPRDSSGNLIESLGPEICLGPIAPLKFPVALSKDALTSLLAARGQIHSKSLTADGQAYSAGTLRLMDVVAVAKPDGRYHGHLILADCGDDTSGDKADIFSLVSGDIKPEKKRSPWKRPSEQSNQALAEQPSASDPSASDPSVSGDTPNA